MDKKAKVFRYVIANLVLVAVLSVTIVFVTGLPVPSVAVVEPVRGGNCSSSVSVAIAVGRDSSGVADILSVLEASDIKATFFVSGAWIIENADYLRAIHLAGHSLGNYGFFNINHVGLPANRIIDEIELTHKLVEGHTGVAMNIFLPPNASYCAITIDIARALGYTTISPKDRATFSSDLTSGELAQKAIASIQGGAILVLPASTNLVAALPQIVNQIKQTELTIVPVCQVINSIES